MTIKSDKNREINRRTMVKSTIAAGTLISLPSLALACESRISKPIKLGVITDLHGGLAVDADSRLDEFLEAVKAEDCDGLVQLGDFAYPNEKHQEFSDKFNAAHDHTIHAIGNHEFDYGLTREDCYKAWGIEKSYYRYDLGGIRILVLDGNDKGSPTHGGGYPSFIGQPQLDWLADELENADRPVLILSHQPLAGSAAVDNATDVQKLLGQHKSKILLCINGHTHIDSLVQVDDVAYLHLNSASYYWVGGKTRMAYYTRPLFSFVTIDPAAGTISVDGRNSDWKSESPKEIGYFDRKNVPGEAAVQPRIRDHHVSRSELTVMTWNIWGRLNMEDRYVVDGKTARQRTVEIIESAQPDIVAMIETYGSAGNLAKSLGYHYHTSAKDANLCIFSRYPLSEVELLEGLNPFSFIAATVTLPGGQKVRVYDIWLTSGGRHIVSIKDKSISDEDFTKGDDNRFDHVKQLLDHADLAKHLQRVDDIPVIIAGDFNCVSHLDHNAETKERGVNHSRDLKIMVSMAMQEKQFLDSYRVANPEVTEETLGHTWTTVGKDYMYKSETGFVPTENHPQPEYQDPYARIDYIYARGKKLQVVSSEVITRHPDKPELQFPMFPSDHAAVVTRFKIEQE